MGRDKRSRSPPRRRGGLQDADFAALGIDAAPVAQLVAPTEVMGAIRATGHDGTGLIPEPAAPTNAKKVTVQGAPPPPPPEALKKFFTSM